MRNLRNNISRNKYNTTRNLKCVLLYCKGVSNQSVCIDMNIFSISQIDKITRALCLCAKQNVKQIVMNVHCTIYHKYLCVIYYYLRMMTQRHQIILNVNKRTLKYWCSIFFCRCLACVDYSYVST